jgi:hypothetical protein
MVLGTSGVSVGFVVVFSLFVVAFIGLLVYIAVWAIRRDTTGWRQWRQEHDEVPEAPTER